MKASHPGSTLWKRGFTIVELLVACVVLMLIMGIVLAMVGQTQEIWKRTNARIETFKSARNAFAALNRSLSQATLNTYWDYDNPNQPQHYLRKSELHFTTGTAEQVLGSANKDRYFGQGVFFQAPLNIGNSTYRGMEKLLNAAGYYIEYGSNADWIPDHAQASSPAAERFRLFQWIQPAEALSVYQPGGSTDWITPDFESGAYPLADNIIALIIWPALENGKVSSLNQYDYDTRRNALDIPQPVSANQLPPLLQVTMVAMSEASAVRLGDALRETVETALDGLFESDPGNRFEEDLKTLEDRLTKARIEYRVFHSSIPMREAKWSAQ